MSDTPVHEIDGYQHTGSQIIEGVRVESYVRIEETGGPCKPGDRIELLQMSDDPCPIEPGTTGTVLSVNGGFYRNQQFQIAVKWDNNRSLSLIWPIDQFKIIEAA